MNRDLRSWGLFSVVLLLSWERPAISAPPSSPPPSSQPSSPSSAPSEADAGESTLPTATEKESGQLEAVAGESPSPTGAKNESVPPEGEGAPSSPAEPLTAKPAPAKPSDARAAESNAAESNAAPTTPEQAQSARSAPQDFKHPHAMCGEVCSQGEACIDGRCLSYCAPSCREGTYCSASRECVPVPQRREAEQTEEESLTGLGYESRHSSKVALIDLGGILFLGARPTFEWGEQEAFHVRLELMNTGVMTYKVEQLNEFQKFQWGFGASFGYRRYEGLGGNMRGFYYGAGVSHRVVEVNDYGQLVAITTHYPGVYGEFGYRWVFGDFVFGFGPALGVRVPVFSHFREIAPGSCETTNSCEQDNEARFEGTMLLEVGFML